jgi:hypothetical protein
MMRSEAELQRVLGLQMLADLFLKRDLILALPVYFQSGNINDDDNTSSQAACLFAAVFRSYCGLVEEVGLSKNSGFSSSTSSKSIAAIILDIYSTELPTTIPAILYSNLASAVKSSLTYSSTAVKALTTYLFNAIEEEVAERDNLQTSVSYICSLPQYSTPHIARPSSQSYESYTADCRREYHQLSESMREAAQPRSQYLNNNLSDDFALLCRWNAVDAMIQHTKLVDIIRKLFESSCLVISSSHDVNSATWTIHLQILDRLLHLLHRMVEQSFYGKDEFIDEILAKGLLDRIYQLWLHLDSMTTAAAAVTLAVIQQQWIRRLRSRIIMSMRLFAKIEKVFMNIDHISVMQRFLVSCLVASTNGVDDRIMQLKSIHIVLCLEHVLSYQAVVDYLSSDAYGVLATITIDSQHMLYAKQACLALDHLYRRLMHLRDKLDDHRIDEHILAVMEIISQLADKFLVPTSLTINLNLTACMFLAVSSSLISSSYHSTNPLHGYLFIPVGYQGHLPEKIYQGYLHVENKIIAFLQGIDMIMLSNQLSSSMLSHARCGQYQSAIPVADMLLNLYRTIFLMKDKGYQLVSFSYEDFRTLLRDLTSLSAYSVCQGLHASALSRLVQEISLFLLSFIRQIDLTACIADIFHMLDLIPQHRSPSYLSALLDIASDCLYAVLPSVISDMTLTDLRSIIQEVVSWTLPSGCPQRSSLMKSSRTGAFVDLTAEDSTVALVDEVIRSDFLHRSWRVMQLPNQFYQWLQLLQGIETAGLMDEEVSIYDKISNFILTTQPIYSSLWHTSTDPSKPTATSAIDVNDQLVVTGCHYIELIFSKLLMIVSKQRDSAVGADRSSLYRTCQEALVTAISKAVDKKLLLSTSSKVTGNRRRGPGAVMDEALDSVTGHLIEAAVFCTIDSRLHAAILSIIISPCFPWRVRERVWRELGELQLTHLLEEWSVGIAINIHHLLTSFDYIRQENSSALARSIAKGLLRLRSADERASGVALLGLLHIAQYLFPATDESSSATTIIIKGSKARLLMDLVDIDGEFMSSSMNADTSVWLVQAVIAAYQWSQSDIVPGPIDDAPGFLKAVLSNWNQYRDSPRRENPLPTNMSIDRGSSIIPLDSILTDLDRHAEHP